MSALVAFGGTPCRVGVERERCTGESLHRVDLASLQLALLEPSQPSYKRQVIIFVSAHVALRPPTANVTVRHWFGIAGGIVRAGPGDSLLQLHAK
jgi:hypothetical protein